MGTTMTLEHLTKEHSFALFVLLILADVVAAALMYPLLSIIGHCPERWRSMAMLGS